MYPHTNFDYPGALCRPSQKERRTEMLWYRMRRRNLNLGVIGPRHLILLVNLGMSRRR
jgi:hypothetical protein